MLKFLDEKKNRNLIPYVYVDLIVFFFLLQQNSKLKNSNSRIMEIFKLI